VLLSVITRPTHACKETYYSTNLAMQRALLMHRDQLAGGGGEGKRDSVRQRVRASERQRVRARILRAPEAE
jgi:hypothetical protein